MCPFRRKKDRGCGADPGLSGRDPRKPAGELRQAQQIVNDRAQIVETANAQAQAIVKKAEERARILVSEARS